MPDIQGGKQRLRGIPYISIRKYTQVYAKIRKVSCLLIMLCWAARLKHLMVFKKIGPLLANLLCFTQLESLELDA